jgi:hypothetical protein
MPKIVNGIEYLSYDEAADEYGLSRKSVQSMVSRDVFKNAKFPHDSKAYISRDELDAYKRRKNKTATEPSTITEKERFTQDVPFLLKVEVVKLMQQKEKNRQMEQEQLDKILSVV